MTPKCAACPVAGECRSYPALCRRMADDPARWRPVLDQVNDPPIHEPQPDAPKPVPLATSLRARKLGALNCPYASKPPCSCQGAAKCWRLGKVVTLRDCIDCLKP